MNRTMMGCADIGWRYGLEVADPVRARGRHPSDPVEDRALITWR
ncbi:hypothetical protein MT3876.1 [Mycobacterium tuberculosis CDC1551]|uniref:Uncharacterized protein n=1 Tax=Mycobacterium tuberculosis (strain CDC 1551 / Oshkosh) TaxID=83331 RepID=Q8VIU1_MYCTO|nr:hypothetical protein MT3876.1 [Mycobacterium tuberculosis CDC1551]